MTRASWYALRTGGWRDYVTLLHVPYTLWHLSYVVIGAAIAPVWLPGRLGWTLAAFALALGIGAHALDELRGRPLATRIPETSSGGSPSPRSRWRSGSGSQPRSRGGRGSQRSSRSEGSSSSRTTSSSSAGRFTPTCGSRSRGDRSRCSPPMRRPPRQSRARLWPRPYSRRCSASPSGCYRRRYGWCGDGRGRSPARSSSTTGSGCPSPPSCCSAARSRLCRPYGGHDRPRGRARPAASVNP